MHFDQRLELALAELKASGTWKSNYYPPLFRLLHLQGIKVRLPHYSGFWNNAILMGGFFGTFFGAVLHFTGGTRLLQTISPNITPVMSFFLVGVPTGLSFGIAMATYYKVSGAWNRLRSWEELEDS